MASEPLFIDTSYIYAITNPNDQWHAQAIQWQAKIVDGRVSLITTQFVLAEIADGLSAVRFRRSASDIVHTLLGDPLIEVVPASANLFHEGLKLFSNRTDKNWGMTDCISFIVMNERGITDALTTDDHFRQAGFRALLLEN